MFPDFCRNLIGETRPGLVPEATAPRGAGCFSDVTKSLATVALVGPESGRIASEVGASELHQLKYFQHTTTEIGGIPVRGMRFPSSERQVGN